MPLLMAVSASATLFMVVAVAVAVVSATPAATIATASATSFAAQHVEHALYFVFCRIAVFSDFADEVQRFSGQGMIQVYGYGIFFTSVIVPLKRAPSAFIKGTTLPG